MAKISRGYENISVDLIHWVGEDLAKQVWDFGKNGETYRFRQDYSPTDPDVEYFIGEVIAGRTFPKYVLEGARVAFRLNNISRINLAQVTREQGFFCSETSAGMPMRQELILPGNLYDRPGFLERYTRIIEELEDMYSELAEDDIPYPDMRYIMPHNETISLTYTTENGKFMRSCASRTDSGWCDEINYMYRLMRYELEKRVEQLQDPLSKKLWQWLLAKSYKVKPFTRPNSYNEDFKQVPVTEKDVFTESSVCNFTKSFWKEELERMYKEEPYLLTEYEKQTIESWQDKTDEELVAESLYDATDPKAVNQAIKNAPYYRTKENRR